MQASDWLRAFVRVRASWPLPAIVALLLLLPLSGPVWEANAKSSLSLVGLGCLCTSLGSACYWLTLWLSRNGLLGINSRWGMREPSSAEVRLVDLACRALCLLIAYAGPVLLALFPDG